MKERVQAERGGISDKRKEISPFEAQWGIARE
jgi:hypothetical protein